MEIEDSEDSAKLDSFMASPDPRDAFLLMLLERISVLETRVHELETGAKELEAGQESLKACVLTSPVVDPSVTKAICVKHTVFSFIIRMGHPRGTPVAEAQLKQEGIDILDKVLLAIGEPNILSATAAIMETNVETIFNLRKRMWRHELVRVLSKLDFPRPVEVLDEIVVRYSVYVFSGKSGICYNVFDFDGHKKEQPTWEEFDEQFFIISHNAIV
jgi:hypothetical protein